MMSAITANTMGLTTVESTRTASTSSVGATIASATESTVVIRRIRWSKDTSTPSSCSAHPSA